MKVGGIYGIKNLVNGKWYIGQSVNIERRKPSHFARLKSGNHRNPYLQRAYLKHGRDNFEFQVIEIVSEDTLDMRECFWIEFYKSTHPQYGYNLETGGNKCKHLSKETKIKISEAQKGIPRKPCSEETRLKMAMTRINKGLGKGIPLSKAHKVKLSIARFGKSFPHKGSPWSESRKKRFSLSRLGAKNSNWRGGISKIYGVAM